MKKPAQCAGTGGLPKDVDLQADTSGYATATAPRQDLYLADRFRLPLATAAVTAELAFPRIETWRERL